MSNTRRDAETQSPDRPEATGTRDKGATALPASIDKEKTPQFHPQTAREVVEKVKRRKSLREQALLARRRPRWRRSIVRWQASTRSERIASGPSKAPRASW